MIGNKLGPYEIRAEIGRGGMATVYRAYQPAVDRDVAIKLIQKHIFSDSTALKRFQREARLIARLEHPHILPLYDFDDTHDPPYIVMRYADGGTLKDVLAQGLLSIEQISIVLRQIGSALDYAHEQGVIHRDIKPSNILLDLRGNVLIGDFGIARAVGMSSTLTAPEITVGTPGYMAPEQSMGPEHLTPQADIYSLGVMLFEMVTGQLPYNADNSLALILKHIHDPIPVATALNPRLPHAIDSVVARAMAKVHIERFASASAFAQAAIQALSIPTPGNSQGSLEQLPNLHAARSQADVPNKTSAGTESHDRHKQRMSLHLSISVLGSIQITLNGQPIAGFEYNKVRSLLIFLAMEQDRPHRRDTLAEMLWPDQAEQVGRDNLRQALSTLRKTISDQKSDPPFLLISRETLQFNPDSQFTLDTNEFTDLVGACAKHHHTQIEACAECAQRLEKAAELYRGPFAQDLALPDHDMFEHWLAFERESFQTQALDALYIVAEYHQQRGNDDLARRYAWRQIELEPWREVAYQQLMRLLALSGQRTAALAQYERCCRILDEELGVAPSDETIALYEQIRSGAIKPIPQYTDSAVIVRRTNLPTAPTSFVGRQKELEQLVQYFNDPACRLVTIIGLGGMGKTRLALEAARQGAAMFQSVGFVPLASLSSADLLPSAIADALQFSTTHQDNFADQLVNYLSDKNLLLTLDNLEHLSDGLGLLAKIVAHAPGVKLLVTSREKLNLQGEWVLRLRGLPIVAAANEPDMVESAVQLFVQRAQMVQPQFAYSSRILPDILRICQIVDGMPLGIELAAAWMQLLTCQEIADSIASNLSFLVAATRDTPERHQSLRAVFEHSWKLLAPEQQRIFRSLAVFRGGFQADSALEVGGATLATLLAFANKSLLQRGPDGRYEIHELLRQYALEKLRESGEDAALFTRHLQFFVTLAETAEPQLQGGQQVPWLERLEAENDNLRAALEWSLVNRAAETGLRLAASLWFFSHVRHYVRESPEWLEKLLTAAPDAPLAVRAKALFAAGWLAQSRRDLPRAQSLSQESLQLARQLGDKRSIAYPLSTLAWLAYFQNDYQQATGLGEESLALFREVNDSWGMVHTLNILGYIAESQAKYAQAEAFQREGMSVARAAGDNDSLAWSIYLLGRIKVECCQYDQAIQLCGESLEIYRELRNNFSIAMVLYTLGDSALALGDFARATELAEESVNLLREMSDFWAVGGPLSCLGMVAYRQGDLPRAHALSLESLGYFQQFGDKRGMAYALNTLGCISHQQAQFKEASDLFKESVALRRESLIQRGLEVCFERLAELAIIQDEYERAGQLFGASESLREKLGILMPNADLEQYTATINRLRQRLGNEKFHVAWERGLLLSLEEAILYALDSIEN